VPGYYWLHPPDGSAPAIVHLATRAMLAQLRRRRYTLTGPLTPPGPVSLLKPTGDADRHTLVAARLNLRGGTN
jgi:hypothetical protein